MCSYSSEIKTCNKLIYNMPTKRSNAQQLLQEENIKSGNAMQ